MPFLRTKTDDEHTSITADYQQNGVHLRAKRMPEKNLYKLLKGLSKEFRRLESALNTWVDGRLLDKRTDFLLEWELTNGIPDEDFEAIGTATERARQCLGKMASDGVHTAEELEWLCSIFGFVVTVTPGYEYWVNPDPRVTLSSVKEARFTIVFETNFALSEPEVSPTLFPVPFPWVFGSNNYNAMVSFFDRIISADVNAQWILPTSVSEVYKDEIGSADVYKDEFGAADVYKDKTEVS